MKVEPGTKEDLPAILELVQSARAELKQLSIPQWQDSYPGKEDFLKDIDEGSLYVLKKAGEVIGVAALVIGVEEAYEHPLKGGFTVSKPYATIHRITVKNQQRHNGSAVYFGEKLIEIAKEKDAKGICVDTHADNVRMQKYVRKLGFVKVAVVMVTDGGLRDGFEILF
ncbi:MAG: GNAT family N-acetyltransferase [Erysipelotrichaceae bacterium]|jgi:ribosomal protein S18 acetylase RimI-like enzyme|nr:GNAT family N-acetyltransferase [Erysipelotrichaceae bacterium]